MSKTIYIGGRLESKENGNVVTGANAILDDTKGKKQNVINKETDDELLRLEQSKQDNLNFDNAPTENSTNPVTSGGVYTAEKALSDAIEAILLLIPSAATALNKLVDTNTMNSSISTATATFRGTYNAVSDLGLTYQATHAQIEAALDALGLTADNNDFVFVQIPVSDESQDIAKTERFKFNGTNWLYEYDLNTSGFTAAQWAAINSGITVALVTKLTDLPTAAALQLAFNAKQDTLTFDTEPTALSQNPVTSGGIYTAIQAVATALSDYSTTTDGRLNILEGLIPTEASSSNKLTDKAYVDGLIQAITELIPAEADTTNQLADKAYVLAQILAATPAFKGQFTTLAELQAVASPKAGDLGIVRTKDSDGMDVFTVYQYLSNAWNVFYSLSYHPQTKPATTGTTGDYPYNGMGRVELAMNMVNTGTELAPVMVNQLTQDMFYKGAVGSRVPNTNTIFVIRYDYELAENITIPDGCVLQFEGGSISGTYTLTFSNTGLTGTPNILCGITGTLGKADISWFGAKPNDSTIDVGAIIEKLNGITQHIIIPTGTYYIQSACNITASRIDWMGTLNYIGSTTAIDVVTISGQFVNLYMTGALICQSASVDYTTANRSDMYGIVFKNCYFGHFQLGFVGRFNVNVKLLGDDSGCSNNTFFISLIRHGNIGILITQKSGGWANENLFIGGDIGNYEPWDFTNCETHAVAVKRMYDDDTDAGANSLMFFKINCEGYQNSAVFVLQDVANSRFEQIRAEQSALMYKAIGTCSNLYFSTSFGSTTGDISEITNAVATSILTPDSYSEKIQSIDLSDAQEISIATNVATGKRYVFGLNSDLCVKASTFSIDSSTYKGQFWGVEVEVPNEVTYLKFDSDAGYIGVVATEFYSDASDVQNSNALLRRGNLSFLFGTTWMATATGTDFTLRKGVKKIIIGFSSASRANITIPYNARIVPQINP